MRENRRLAGVKPMITVMLAPVGEEQRLKGENVVKKDGYIVIRNWNRRTRKWEDGDMFPVSQVAWACDAEGHIVLGDGQVKPK
jgi:hypothetical protein